jgi:hypothetical protein
MGGLPTVCIRRQYFSVCRSKMRHLVCVCLHEGRASRGARDIVATGRAIRQPVATLADMENDSITFEDRDVSISQPWHLAERLVREMLGIPSEKWHALVRCRPQTAQAQT